MAGLLLFMGWTADEGRGEDKNTDPLPLTVRDCLSMALQNNLNISIERLNPMISEAGVTTARGAFVPSFVITPGYGETRTPLDYGDGNFSGGLPYSQTRTMTLAPSFQGKTSSGATYNLGFAATDTQTISGAFRDYYSSNWGLTLTQPLLRNFGTDVNLTPLRIAQKQVMYSNEGFAYKVMDVVTQVREAYYQLCSALENRKVQFKSLEYSVRLLEDNRKKVSIGSLAALDITKAEAEVAKNEESVVLANKSVAERTIDLRALIARDMADIRHRPIQPMDRPLDREWPAMDVDLAIVKAMENRPDYRQAMLNIDKLQLQLRYDKNQRYPQVDLQGTYGYNGIGTSFTRSMDIRDKEWSAGLAVTIPLPDLAAEGKYEATRLQKEQAILQLKLVEQNIVVGVDKAIKAVDYNYQRIKAARVSVQTARAVYEGEFAKMQIGTSTSFEVLRLQRDLISSETSEISAIADYNISLAVLEKVMGLTLDVNNIELVRPGNDLRLSSGPAAVEQAH